MGRPAKELSAVTVSETASSTLCRAPARTWPSRTTSVRLPPARSPSKSGRPKATSIATCRITSGAVASSTTWLAWPLSSRWAKAGIRPAKMIEVVISP